MGITIIKFTLLFGMARKLELSHIGNEAMRICKEEEEVRRETTPSKLAQVVLLLICIW
jgi:hypothetical protein